MTYCFSFKSNKILRFSFTSRLQSPFHKRPSSMAMLNPEAPEFISVTSLFPLNSQLTLPYTYLNTPRVTTVSPFPSHTFGFDAVEVFPSFSFYTHCCFNYLNLPLHHGWETPPPPPPPLCVATTMQPAMPVLVHAHRKEKSSSTTNKAKKVFWNFGFRNIDRKGNMIWVPKSRNMEKSSGRNVSQEAKECKKAEPDCIKFGDLRTTVMIKNIPNRQTEMLLELLDKHCMEENEKVKSTRTRRGNEDFSSAFDFLYLPMDFRSGCNLGYAFVNFTDPRATWRLNRLLHKQRWEIPGSKKICEITYARVQGKAALLKHFENSKFHCESDEFLPISFIPHRSGPSGWQPASVGKRISPCRAPHAISDYVSVHAF